MDINLIASIVTQTLVYAAPLILTALGEFSQNEAGSSMLVWKESWLWELLPRLFSTSKWRIN